MNSNMRFLAILFVIGLWLSSHTASAGFLYVSNANTGNIFDYTPSGVQSTFASGLSYPQGLAFDSNDNLFVGNANTGNIYEYTPSGVGSTFASGLSQPDALAFDSNGNLFVSNANTGNIYEYTPSGAGSTFASGLSYPKGLAFDKNGNLFVANANTGNIFEFTPSGVQSTFASGLSNPDALAFDKNGNLYVANANTGNIFEFTPSGVQSTFASGLSYPQGLAFDSNGNLYVGNSNTGNIYEYTPSGVGSTFASGLSQPDAVAFPPEATPEPSTLVILLSVESCCWDTHCGRNDGGAGPKPKPFIAILPERHNVFKKHPEFDTPSDDTVIWRYFDFTKFMSLLQERTLFFTRGDKFHDLFEGSLPKRNAARLMELFSKENRSPGDARELGLLNRKFVAVNCWHLDDIETDAMWRLYLKGKGEGVAIRSTVRGLKTSLKDPPGHVCSVFIGTVKYIDYDTAEFAIQSQFTRFLHKRLAFKHDTSAAPLVEIESKAQSGEFQYEKLSLWLRMVSAFQSISIA